MADGGYARIGLHAPCPSVFAPDMAWSTAVVAGETLHRFLTLGLSVWTGPVLHDIDTQEDLVHVPPAWLSGEGVIREMRLKPP